MTTSYFLGANSSGGFYSLYDHFAAQPGDTLHIIKSGPGTGKSTFMRRIGSAAEKHGMDVEYILCSGDPQSLDGVYIPALRTGWVDGTAPHVLEPKHFGIQADYVNLGTFCSTAKLNPTEIRQLTNRYRSCYTKAYTYLNAAGLLWRQRIIRPDAIGEEKLRSRAGAKIRKELSNTSPSTPTKRFLRALSCGGDVVLSQTLNTLCDRICVLESDYGLEQLFFEEILRELNSRQSPYIHCPSPLCPEETEAVILPAERLCFLSGTVNANPMGTVRTIHPDAYLQAPDKSEHRQRDKLFRQLTDSAFVHLSQAKQLHDELERYYRPALDVDRLNAYTEDVIKGLF